MDREIEKRFESIERRITALYDALGQSEPGQSTGEIAPGVKDLVTSKQRAGAIKQYAKENGTTLTEAKEAIDRIVAGG